MNQRQTSLEESIHYRFDQVKLLTQALTHSSHANEQGGGAFENNERLEFLGDAVLELVVSRELYERYPEAAEGNLTRIRSSLVKEAALAGVAREIRLDQHLLLGKGEEGQGGRNRDSLLADGLEALIGAIFLDGGFEPAMRVVLDLLQDRWPQNLSVPRPRDYKSRLQELTQQLYKDRPVYSLLGASGPEHEKVFEVSVRLPTGETFIALETSLKRAEQGAAAQALHSLGERQSGVAGNPPPGGENPPGGR
ncbi:MAG: ribonuclease III [Desulfovibrionaceae bacterium]